MLGTSQEIAVRRSGIHARQYWHGALEYIVMQTNPNRRQILGAIDRHRLVLLAVDELSANALLLGQMRDLLSLRQR